MSFYSSGREESKKMVFFMTKPIITKQQNCTFRNNLKAEANMLAIELDLSFWVRLRKNSEPRTLTQEIYLDSHRGRRSEPAGPHRLANKLQSQNEGFGSLGSGEQRCVPVREGVGELRSRDF